MLNRRNFLIQAGKGAGLLIAGGFPVSALASRSGQSITILHTNDVHSRLEPFPMDGSSLQGKGGIAARKTLIDQIRKEEEHVLLLDAGDIFQGTTYFNFYKGEPEIKAMSMLGYDAATMGNHEFDGGIDGFAKQLPFARFPFLVSNYQFEDTILEGKIRSYKIFRKGNLKIGVFGLGIELWGLVPREAYDKIKYQNAVEIARSVSGILKKRV